jgi:dihydrofolate synthase/folylpolyglutamate synthase
MADKDYTQMCRMIIPYAAKVITVTPDNPRALSAEKLAVCFKANGFESAVPYDSVTGGITAALETAAENDVICAFGSFYMAGTIRSCFGLS